MENTQVTNTSTLKRSAADLPNTPKTTQTRRSPRNSKSPESTPTFGKEERGSVTYGSERTEKERPARLDRSEINRVIAEVLAEIPQTEQKPSRFLCSTDEGEVKGPLVGIWVLKAPSFEQVKPKEWRQELQKGGMPRGTYLHIRYPMRGVVELLMEQTALRAVIKALAPLNPNIAAASYEDSTDEKTLAHHQRKLESAIPKATAEIGEYRIRGASRTYTLRRRLVCIVTHKLGITHSAESK